MSRGRKKAPDSLHSAAKNRGRPQGQGSDLRAAIANPGRKPASEASVSANEGAAAEPLQERSGAAPPAGSPAWVTAELIADTIATWQPYFREALTAEDALEILQDVGHLIDILGNGQS